MVSYGDEIDVHDYGICRLNEEGKITVYLVEEEDRSINWYINYAEHSDQILLVRKVDFVRER